LREIAKKLADEADAKRQQKEAEAAQREAEKLERRDLEEIRKEEREALKKDRRVARANQVAEWDAKKKAKLEAKFDKTVCRYCLKGGNEMRMYENWLICENDPCTVGSCKSDACREKLDDHSQHHCPYLQS
jgi:hypothetical protein